MNATMTRAAPTETRKGPPAARQSRAASVAPGSYDPKTRTFGVVLSSFADVKRFGMYERLSSDPADWDISRVAAGQVKLLDSHNQGSASAVLGTLTEARFEGARLVGTVQLGESDAARALEPNIASGHLKGISIGYSVRNWKLVETDDGREVYEASGLELAEVSLVGVPADSAAMIRSAPGAEDDDADRNAPSAMTARQAMNLIDRAEFYGERDLAERMVRQGHDEQTVMQAVTEARRRAGDVAASIGGPRAGLYEEMNTLGYRSDNEGRPYMHTNTAHNAETLDNPQFARRAAEDALYARIMGRAPEGAATRFMGLRLEQYDDALAELRGERRSWLAPRGGSWLGGTRGSMTTSDFPIVLGGAMNRSLHDLMKAAETGASAIVRVGTVRDFREHTEVSTSSFPALKKIKESGEFTYGAIDENGETIQAESFGRAVSITFQAMKNDDLGAIERAIRDFAFAANELKASTILSALTGVMSDNKALFHTDHGNLAGSGAAPDVTTLSNARAAMRAQKALDGVTPLGLAPRVLLVPSSLETVAEQLVTSIQATIVDDVNPFAGKLIVAAEPRLSGNAWYLFADPGVYASLKFVTLDGFASPAFEQDSEFSRLGMSYRVHWHIGAAPVDYRGAYKNPGA